MLSFAQLFDFLAQLLPGAEQRIQRSEHGMQRAEQRKEIFLAILLHVAHFQNQMFVGELEYITFIVHIHLRLKLLYVFSPQSLQGSIQGNTKYRPKTIEIFIDYRF